LPETWLEEGHLGRHLSRSPAEGLQNEQCSSSVPEACAAVPGIGEASVLRGVSVKGIAAIRRDAVGDGTGASILAGISIGRWRVRGGCATRKQGESREHDR
jgi:hypothetical protein